MSTVTDLEINRHIRRILVKHWIDLGRLAVRTTGGHAAIHGVLQRVEGHPEPILPATLDAMFADIRRIPGIQRVRPHLENWTLDAGSWKQVERAAFEQEAANDSLTGMGKQAQAKEQRPKGPGLWNVPSDSAG